MCGDFVTATVLGGADGNMIGAMIDSQFKGAQDWPLGSAMAVMMIGAVLLVLGIGFLLVSVIRLVLRRMRSVTLPEVAR
jgi:spermidine/putrescine transport system permease protein